MLQSYCVCSYLFSALRYSQCLWFHAAFSLNQRKSKTGQNAATARSMTESMGRYSTRPGLLYSHPSIRRPEQHVSNINNLDAFLAAGGKNGVVTIGGYTPSVGAAGGYIVGGGTGTLGRVHPLSFRMLIPY